MLEVSCCSGLSSVFGGGEILFGTLECHCVIGVIGGVIVGSYWE